MPSTNEPRAHEHPGNVRTESTSIPELIEKRVKLTASTHLKSPRSEDRIPTLADHQKLDLDALRHPLERKAFRAVVIANVVFFSALLVATVLAPPLLLVVGVVAGFVWVVNALSYRLFYWMLYGNSVLVSEHQYPEIHDAVVKACRFMELKTIPTVFILHGNGLMELLLIKRFTKRGVLIFTSELIDTLLASGDSRQLMMIIGRQLGHIRAGHYRFWALKEIVGRLAFVFHSAWSRGCDYTADRVGYMVCGNLEASRLALISMTVGKHLPAATNLAGIEEQRRALEGPIMAWLSRILQTRPFMIHRICALETFRDQVLERAVDPASDRLIGFLPSVVSVFEIIVHGHAIFGDSGKITVMQPVAVSP